MGRSARRQPSHGVHWADGIAFLLQRQSVTNALGVDFPAPFEPDHKVPCPHHIHVPTRGVVHPQGDDPLFKAFSPVPEPGLYVVHKPLPLLRQLEELCSPVEPLSIPYWFWNTQQLRGAVQWTNCAPLVLTGFKLRDTRNIPRIADIARASQRRVLLVAEEPLPRDDRFPLIRSEIEAIEEPHLLRPAGATMLTEYMLRGPGSQPST